MKILCTGSEGYIGSKLCKALTDLGHEVFRVDTKLGITISNSYFRDVDLIYHLAAQTDVQYSRINPLYDALNNVGSTIEILTKYPKTKIIYTASAASLEINSPYGLSKWMCEEYIKLLNPNHVICVIPNPWGEGGHGAVDKFMDMETIRINGDGLQSRTIIHVQDIIKALLKAMEWNSGTYKLGGDERFKLSVKEIAERVSKKTGASLFFDLSYDPKKQGEVFSATLPNTTPNWEATIEL